MTSDQVVLVAVMSVIGVGLAAIVVSLYPSRATRKERQAAFDTFCECTENATDAKEAALCERRFIMTMAAIDRALER